MIDGLPFAVFQPFIDTATGRIAGVEALGGKGGGGRPDMAQGGGPDGSKAAEALAAVKAVLAA